MSSFPTKRFYLILSIIYACLFSFRASLPWLRKLSTIISSLYLILKSFFNCILSILQMYSLKNATLLNAYFCLSLSIYFCSFSHFVRTFLNFQIYAFPSILNGGFCLLYCSNKHTCSFLWIPFAKRYSVNGRSKYASFSSRSFSSRE